MIEKVDTKTRILDAAERLIALHGFEATSLRDITADAGVNLAAVNYHFQSKDSLIDAVIERRIEPVNRKRLELPAAAGSHPALPDILKAFLAPVLAADLGPAVSMMGRMLANPEQFLDRVFRKHLIGVSQRFQEALAQAVPHLAIEERTWRFHFVVGMMAHTLCCASVLPGITNGICTLSDRQALIERAVAFSAAGFQAPAAQFPERTKT